MANYEDNRRFGMTKLGENNYYIWKQRTELWLRREKLWDHIERPPPNPVTDSWLDKDSQAKATIGLLVEDKFLIDINTQATAKETWDRLKSIHQQSSLGARLALYRKIFSARYTPNVTMIDHITGILDAASKLEDAGHKIIDEELCAAILGSLPKEYDVLITTIEGRDSKTITIDYVREKIIEEYNKKTGQGFNSSHETKAMPTQSIRGNRNFKKTYTCYYCHKVGHIRRECRLLANHEAHKEHQTTPSRETAHHSKSTATFSPAYWQEPAENPILEESDNTMHQAMTTRAATSPLKRRRWIIDTGAGDHMCQNEKMLNHVRKLSPPIQVMTASGETHTANTTGEYEMVLNDHNGNPKVILLKEVLVMNTLSDDLISISKLDEQGYRVNFKNGECWTEAQGDRIHLGNLHHNLYILSENKANYVNTPTSCIHVWHNRLGHRNTYDIRRMSDESMTEGLHIKKCDTEGICSPCVLTKKSNLPFHKTTLPRSHRPFEVLHSDLTGPITPTSLGGNKYALSIIDDFSGFSTVYMLNSKDQTSHRIKEFIEHGINTHHRRPRAFVSDGGGEYCNNETDRYFKNKGIRHIVTLPYTPQENGRSERHNRTLLESVRALLRQSKLPKNLWGEMALTATYLINRICQQGKTKTPYELWNNRKPKLHHLKTIGLECYYYNLHPHKLKLEDRSTHGILVGYGPSEQFYRVWDPLNNKIQTSRSVTFHLERCPLTQEDHSEECTYLKKLPESEEDITALRPQQHDPRQNEIRRSNRSNLGKPPTMLTYNEEFKPKYEPLDWHNNPKDYENDPNNKTGH